MSNPPIKGTNSAINPALTSEVIFRDEIAHKIYLSSWVQPSKNSAEFYILQEELSGVAIRALFKNILSNNPLALFKTISSDDYLEIEKEKELLLKGGESKKERDKMLTIIALFYANKKKKEADSEQETTMQGYKRLLSREEPINLNFVTGAGNPFQDSLGNLILKYADQVDLSDLDPGLISSLLASNPFMINEPMMQLVYMAAIRIGMTTGRNNLLNAFSFTGNNQIKKLRQTQFIDPVIRTLYNYTHSLLKSIVMPECLPNLDLVIKPALKDELLREKIKRSGNPKITELSRVQTCLVLKAMSGQTISAETVKKKVSNEIFSKYPGSKEYYRAAMEEFGHNVTKSYFKLDE